jgi:hypothetical protein
MDRFGTFATDISYFQTASYYPHSGSLLEEAIDPVVHVHVLVNVLDITRAASYVVSSSS